MAKYSIFLSLEAWAERPGMGLGLLTPEISLLKLYPSHTRVRPFHAYISHIGLDGCGFFISVVVSLPFNLVSDGFE